jgi:ribosomal protein S27E
MSDPGKRYRCGTCGTEVIVSRGGEGTLECSDTTMAVEETSPAGGAHGGEPSPLNHVGKRLSCEDCGAEVIVVKAGEGEIRCDGKPMSEAAVRQIASAD